MRFEKSCGAVIFRRDGQNTLYLLLHYESGHWDFVKGHVEEGESETNTLVRETEEETGLKDLHIADGFREKVNYFFHQKGEKINKTVVFFLAETKTEKIKISDEHKDFTWLPYEDAYKKLTFKNAKDIFEKANKKLSCEAA